MAVRRTVASYDEIAGDYWASWRDREMMEEPLSEFVRRIRSGGLVVDVGCGPGFDAARLEDAGLRTVALDLSWGMVTVGRQHYSCVFVQGDMRRLPLGGGTVDGLWVNASLLHLPPAEGEAALREFYRVLRPEGALFLSVKEGTGTVWRETSWGERAPRFFAYWEAARLDRVLEAAGFKVAMAWRSEAASIWLSRIVIK